MKRFIFWFDHLKSVFGRDVHREENVTQANFCWTFTHLKLLHMFRASLCPYHVKFRKDVLWTPSLRPLSFEYTYSGLNSTKKETINYRAPIHLTLWWLILLVHSNYTRIYWWATIVNDILFEFTIATIINAVCFPYLRLHSYDIRMIWNDLSNLFDIVNFCSYHDSFHRSEALLFYILSINANWW